MKQLEELKTIYNQDPDVGAALTPLLDRFEWADATTLTLVARAMLDAYGAGQRNGMKAGREIALSALKAVNS